jgi:hypothetical protein
MPSADSPYAIGSPYGLLTRFAECLHVCSFVISLPLQRVGSLIVETCSSINAGGLIYTGVPRFRYF